MGLDDADVQSCKSSLKCVQQECFVAKAWFLEGAEAIVMGR